MPRHTKTQTKRMLKAIERKAWVLVGEQVITIKDYDVISRVTARCLKKLN